MAGHEHLSILFSFRLCTGLMCVTVLMQLWIQRPEGNLWGLEPIETKT